MPVESSEREDGGSTLLFPANQSFSSFIEEKSAGGIQNFRSAGLEPNDSSMRH